MKPLPTLLLMGVLVVVGIFVYDQIRQDDDTEGAFVASTEPSGRGEARLGMEPLDRINHRLTAIERQLDEHGKAIADLRKSIPDPAALRGSLADGPVDPETVVDIDDRTLQTLDLYMAELQRRRRAKAMRSFTEQKLDRMDLPLKEGWREQIIELTVAHQQRAQTLWGELRKRGITDRQAQLAELKKFRETFIANLAPYVDEQDLDRAVDGLIGKDSAIQIPPGARVGPPVPDRPDRPR